MYVYIYIYIFLFKGASADQVERSLSNNLIFKGEDRAKREIENGHVARVLVYRSCSPTRRLKRSRLSCSALSSSWNGLSLSLPFCEHAQQGRKGMKATVATTDVCTCNAPLLRPIIPRNSAWWMNFWGKPEGWIDAERRNAGMDALEPERGLDIHFATTRFDECL